MWIETNELIKKWLEPALSRWEDIEIATRQQNSCRVYSQGDLIGIEIRIPTTLAIVTLPDSIASNQMTPQFHPKIFEFDLHEPDSLQKITNLVVGAIESFKKHSVGVVSGNRGSPVLSVQDAEVLVDLLLEKLPMVWQDAVAAIEGGEEPGAVLEETYNGHILRILRRLGHDVDDWFGELTEYVGVQNG